MSNFIKYSTGSTPAGCLRKGNMLIGNNTAEYGATFYTGITPAVGGYTIYQNKASQGPSIYTPSNDSNLVVLTNTQVAGTVASPASYTTAAQCLNYYASQSDKICSNLDYEGTVTDGLVLNVDAGFTPSYPQGGTGWYDISGGGITGILTNGPTFNSSNNGSIVFDGSNDYVDFGNQNLGIDLIDKSFCAWVYLGASLANPTGIIDKDFDTSPGVYGGWGFWVGSDRKLWWWNSSNADIRDNGSSTVGTNTWSHIAVTYNSSTKTAAFYINGSLNSSASNGAISEKSSGSQPLYISGIRAASQGIINGRVANIFAYNRILTAAEVLQNYNAQKSRYGL